MRNGTARSSVSDHDLSMVDAKSRKKSSDAIRARVRKEMAKPCIAKSARDKETIRDYIRIKTQVKT